MTTGSSEEAPGSSAEQPHGLVGDRQLSEEEAQAERTFLKTGMSAEAAEGAVGQSPGLEEDKPTPKEGEPAETTLFLTKGFLAKTDEGSAGQSHVGQSPVSAGGLQLSEGEAPAEGVLLEASTVSKLRLVPNQAGDAELYEAWEQWHSAYMDRDLQVEKKALDVLVRLRRETGARAFEAFAVGLIRAAASRDIQNDKERTELLTQAAMQLAPDLPAVYIGATGICLQRFSEEWRHCAGLFWQVVKSWMDDPRYRRSTLTDIGVAALFGFVVTAVAAMLVFFLRSLPCLFADFYLFFQRTAFPKWFVWMLLLGILCLPLILRVGLAMILLIFFLAIALYLRRKERLFLTVVIVAMSVVPLAGEWFARRTTFGGTVAEKLWMLDLGGPGTEALAHSWKEALRTSRGSFAELAALGTFELRRGDNEAAIGHLRRALSLRAEEPRAMNNLGVALFLKGELEQAQLLFEQAAHLDKSLGEPLYNLIQLLDWPSHQGAVLSAQELNRISELRARVSEKAPRLLELRPTTAAGAISANTFLQTVSLDSRDILNAAKLEADMELIRMQLTRMLVLDSPSLVTPWMALLMAVIILLLSFLGDSLDTSERCALCGQIHRKKMLSMDRSACLDCTRVFLQKSSGVEPLVGFKKRLDTARFRKKHKRFVYSLSLLWPGAGLLYVGKFISGVLYSFIFGFAASALIYRRGFMRVPYSEIPFSFYVVPLTLIFGFIYFLSIASLFRAKDAHRGSSRDT
ncbi:MAG: hypothetical protein FWG75_03000 [Cystobacterineae bacterium]|nr:hypothetical protein [Cystobacterineae bacterium]